MTYLGYLETKGRLSRREAIGAAVVVVGALIWPAAAHAGPPSVVPVTVRISWREGDARDGGEGTIAAVTAAVAAVGGGSVWVHRLA